MGGTTVIMPAFEVQAFLHAVVDERINVLTSVPAIYWLAMNQPNFQDFDVSAVKWLAYGGAPTAPDVIERLLKSFPNARLGNGFGLTETSSVSTFLPARVLPTSGPRPWGSPRRWSSSTSSRSTSRRTWASC